MDRRTALTLVGTLCGYLYGRPVRADQGQGLTLALDSVDAIVLQYRGRRVVVTPAEVLEALVPSAPTAQMPWQYPLPPTPSKK